MDAASLHIHTHKDDNTRRRALNALINAIVTQVRYSLFTSQQFMHQKKMACHWSKHWTTASTLIKNTENIRTADRSTNFGQKVTTHQSELTHNILQSRSLQNTNANRPSKHQSTIHLLSKPYNEQYVI